MTNQAEKIALVIEMLTAEGRSPPRAVYRESFPTGIPIPCRHLLSSKLAKTKELREQSDRPA